MPKVGKMEFPYTAKGMADAKKAKKKMAKPMKKAMAKASAKKAGRPYPKLIDNMKAAQKRG